MAQAYSLDLSIDAGSTFTRAFLVQDALTGNPRDLTGYQFRASAKLRKSDTQPAFTFVVTVADPASGQFTLQLFESVSQNIPAGQYYYDVKADTGVSSERMIEGIVTIDVEVTS